MLVYDALEELEGNYIKLGSKVNYIYCGKVKDLRYLFTTEEVKEKQRINAGLETNETNIKYCLKSINRLKEDIESINNADILEEDTKQKIIKGKVKKIRELKRDLKHSANELVEFKKLYKDFKPIMLREVIDIYPSEIENATIVIFRGGERGKYWTINEYKKGNKVYG